MSHVFLARYHHGLCSAIIYHPSGDIKIYLHLVPAGIFRFEFSGDVINAYAKILLTKFQRKAIVNYFFRAGTDSLVKNKVITSKQW